jgi:hypothetical protein
VQIQNAMPCIWYRNSRTQFYESKYLNAYRICRSDSQSLFPSRKWLTLGEIVKQLLARLPVGLPAALISSLLGATFYSKLLEVRAPEMEQKCHSIPWPIQKRTALETLLLGVLAGALLAIVEVSLRRLFV